MDAKYIPLASVALPLATFINLQSVAAGGWVYEYDTHRSIPVQIASILAILSGCLGSVALFVRMLEYKIKWMSRLIIYGSYLQFLLNVITLTLFLMDNRHVPVLYNAEVLFNILSAIASFGVATLTVYLHHQNKNQAYVYVM
jgi:hypothetical protein